MLRVSVELHPYGGGVPREIAAIAIGNVGEVGGGRHRYVALTTQRGGHATAAVVEHVRSHGALALVEAVLIARTNAAVHELTDAHREALARKLGPSEARPQQ